VRSAQLAKRRRENFKAMKSPASVVLGLAAIALVAAVCVFYDHPAMGTPRVISLLHSNVAGDVTRVAF
jgi:hypothetical protein